MRPRAGGGLVVATETGVVLLDEDDAPTLLCEIVDEPGIRMNDGGCDPQGRFWCGTMAYDARAGAGTLYRVEPDGSFATALAGVTISNGLGWSPDGATAFYVDSTAQRIDTFAFDGASGELGERRALRRDRGEPRPPGRHRRRRRGRRLGRALGRRRGAPLRARRQRSTPSCRSPAGA